MKSFVCRVGAPVALCTALAVPAIAQDVTIDSETFGGLAARSIGPAVMSGRIAALDVAVGERLTIYAGAAGGGLWKSDDGGLQFSPVFDKHSQSIGAVRVDAKDSKTVWVGTGESWVRNSVSVGDGLYKSTDAGESWARVGLESSERIARIAIDPSDSQTVYVCALGHAFDDHADRGVFRTKDGGKSWEKVLYVAPDTGCADLALDPHDPKTLLAGMWQFRRRPDFFTSGGPKSGLHRTTDGGATWKAVREGLAAGDLGRIAVSPSPAKAGLWYATVESKATALYRSEDGGVTWKDVNNQGVVTQRPFYFSLLVADPKEPERVYKPGLMVAVSDDGGKTFSPLGAGGLFGASYHSDVHALWIHPQRPDELVIGTDGGVYLSHDRGRRWRFVGSLPVSQFYHVSYDLAEPYNVYGGLQDNATWYGPSRHSGGVLNKHWSSLVPGDGFWAFVDPSDPDVVYAEYQGGNLFRVRKSVGENKDIKPSARQGEPKYRFNWNTPIHLSPTEKGTIYYGAQFLFRSKDRGESWERISPDLTTNDPKKLRQDESGGLTLDNSTAENHCTIFAIAESPKNASVVWVGTDDGNVQVTRDGGKAWTNVTAAIGLPRPTWVSSLQASAHDEGVAYATFDGHMTGDMTPHVYRTDDFGKTWQSLGGKGLAGYAHVVKEDPVNPRLLFVGTELGLFVSVDGGAQWGQFKANLPNVAVRDLAIHPRDHDLVIATHGRGIYVLDDLTPLRRLTSDMLSAEAAFLDSRSSAMTIPTFSFGFPGDSEFEGRSPSESAVITYYLKKRHMFGDLKFEISDSAGNLLSTVNGSKRRGLNRVEWPMRAKPPRTPPGAGLIPNLYSFLGPRAPEGVYNVKMIKGQDSFTSQVKLVPDPRSTHTAGDRALQQKTVMELYALMERLAFLVDGISDLRDQALAAGAKAPPDLARRLTALAASFEAQRTALVSSKQGEGISGEQKLREELGVLYGNVNGFEGRPTQSQIARMGVLTSDLLAAEKKLDTAAAGEVAAVNKALTAKSLPALTRLEEAAWRKKGTS